MLSVVTKESSERAAIIELGVSETGLSEAILEKDLWVCYLLDYLRMSFTPPHGREQEGALAFTRSHLAENYRILYEGLLPYYRAHRPERLAWLEQLIRDALNYRRMQERREREYNQVSRLL